MKEFLSGTRKRLISLLRSGNRTVAELSSDLGLTDNAVRAHLESLSKQRLVAASGTRPGTRKPHVIYGLTSQGRGLFFEGCHPLLTQLIKVLSAKLPEGELAATMRECGRRMGRACLAQAGRVPAAPADRLAFALESLRAMGGQPIVVQRRDGRTEIRGAACPWAAVVPDHPEVCVAAEGFLSEVLKRPVSEHCVRGETAHCLFRIV